MTSPIKHYTVEEGLLTFGEVASAMEATAQVESCKVSHKVEKKDDRPTLSGDRLAGQRTFPATLSGKVVQDLTEGGLTEWSWTHAGEELPFTFTPSGAEGRSVTGVVVVQPLDVGGDVEEEAPSAEFEWDCVGRPELVADLV